MDLLEYQAKELFQEVGIPVPPSESIDDPRQMRQIELSYPLVLKSQVRAVGRAKAGGIRFVENTIDAIAAARAIFSLPIRGQYPRILLAEARYPVQQELFLAIAIDYQLQRPVLLGAAAEDLKGKGASKCLKRVTIDGEFSPFYARRLAIAMGLQKEAIESVAAVISKMYALFSDKDLDCIEINPLGLNECGEVMALDGKIAVNPQALARHPELTAVVAAANEPSDSAADERSVSPSLHWPEPNGKIGLLCNGLGPGMALWDLLQQQKGQPAGCWILGGDTGGRLLPPAAFVKAFEEGFAQWAANPQIEVILVNLLADTATIERLIETLAALRPPEDAEVRPQVVVRLAGGNTNATAEQLALLPLFWTENLESAVEQAIALC